MTGFYMKCNTGLKWVIVKQDGCFLYIHNNQIQLFYTCLIGNFIRSHISRFYFLNHFLIWLLTLMPLFGKKTFGFYFDMV